MKYRSKSKGPSKDSKKILRAFGGIYKSSAEKEISSPLIQQDSILVVMALIQSNYPYMTRIISFLGNFAHHIVF